MREAIWATRCRSSSPAARSAKVPSVLIATKKGERADAVGRRGLVVVGVGEYFAGPVLSVEPVLWGVVVLRWVGGCGDRH